MDLKSKLPYHTRLFLLLITFAWVLFGCFIAFQYKREKFFKAEKLDSQLQLFNLSLLDAIEEGKDIGQLLQNSTLPFHDLRVSVIRNDGTVLYDNMVDITSLDNHADRPEVIEALKKGTGYQSLRHSASADKNYFYSAMEGHTEIVRSAVPYSVSLKEILAADRNFLGFMLSVTLTMSLVIYYFTRLLGNTITRLNLFAKKVQSGSPVEEEDLFPHNELGDISNHLVQMYAQLQKATEELRQEHKRTIHEQQEKIRIKKQLTNNINHELKTPIAVIQACLETLMTRPEIDEERKRDFIRQCYVNSERLCRMLNDISLITRMDEAGSMIAKEPQNLRTLILNVIAEMQISIEDHGVCVENRFGKDITVTGNATLLRSIFHNLLDNALAYSGCRNIWIDLLEDTPDHCKISFRDDGSGVEPHHLAHLFERFYRVDKGRSRKLGGTGLGLSIVKNSILFHKGTVTVHNSTQGGLEFIFTIAKGN